MKKLIQTITLSNNMSSLHGYLLHSTGKATYLEDKLQMI